MSSLLSSALTGTVSNNLFVNNTLAVVYHLEIWILKQNSRLHFQRDVGFYYKATLLDNKQL